MPFNGPTSPRTDQFKKLGDSEIEFNHYLGIETLMYILSCQTGLHPDLSIGTKQKGQGSNIFADGCPRFMPFPEKKLTRRWWYFLLLLIQSCSLRHLFLTLSPPHVLNHDPTGKNFKATPWVRWFCKLTALSTAIRNWRIGLHKNSCISRQNLRETGKLRTCSKITRPNLGFVKKGRKILWEPWPFLFLFSGKRKKEARLARQNVV